MGSLSDYTQEQCSDRKFETEKNKDGEQGNNRESWKEKKINRRWPIGLSWSFDNIREKKELDDC